MAINLTAKKVEALLKQGRGRYLDEQVRGLMLCVNSPTSAAYSGDMPSQKSRPGDPYGAPFRVRPQAGLLVLFPSWLYHWVHPYAGRTPRIAVSFNATQAKVAELRTSTPRLRHQIPISVQLTEGKTDHVDSTVIR